MIMKNKYVLNIKGHVENNNSYYEEYNSNYSINVRKRKVINEKNYLFG